MYFDQPCRLTQPHHALPSHTEPSLTLSYFIIFEVIDLIIDNLATRSESFR